MRVTPPRTRLPSTTVSGGVFDGSCRPSADGSLRFRNSLVHDTAYEGLPFRRRRELHARVADVIEGASESLEDEAAALALHYAAAARHPETWRYARTGGGPRARGRRERRGGEALRARARGSTTCASGHPVRTSRRADLLWKRPGDARDAWTGAYDALRRASGLLLPLSGRACAGLRTPSITSVCAPGRRGSRSATQPPGLLLVDGRATEGREWLRHALPCGSIRAQVRGDSKGSSAGGDRDRRAGGRGGARQVNELEALGRAYGVLDEAYQTLGEDGQGRPRAPRARGLPGSSVSGERPGSPS